MPVDRNRGIPTPTVAHEGNPRQDSLVVTGTLDGEAFINFLPPDAITGIPAPDAEPPPSNSDCPGCEAFTLSIEDTVNEALCASDTGDGCVVTCPGDYSSDPTFFGEACTHYYGPWRFGLNAIRHDDIPAPSWYTTSPSLWVPPQGFISVNSSCAGRVSKELRFDYAASSFGSTVDYTDITPATFQSLVIDDWNSTGAHGQRPAATPDGTANVDVTVGGFMDCRFLLSASASGYYIQVSATYLSELHNPISGLAILTDDGAGATLTGYGIIINRVNDTVNTVQWDNAAPANYTVLDQQSYTPLANDGPYIQVWQKCPCPYGSTDPSSIHPAYPKGGFIYSAINRSGDILPFTSTVPTYPSGLVGSVTPEQFQALSHGALIAIQVNNGFCDNIAVYRNVGVKFGSQVTSC